MRIRGRPRESTRLWVEPKQRREPGHLGEVHLVLRLELEDARRASRRAAVVVPAIERLQRALALAELPRRANHLRLRKLQSRRHIVVDPLELDDLLREALLVAGHERRDALLAFRALARVRRPSSASRAIVEGPRRGASPRDRRRRARPDRRGTRWPTGPGSGAASSSARTSRRVCHTPGRDTPGGIVHGHGRARAYPPSPARAGMKVRSETAHFFPRRGKASAFRFISLLGARPESWLTMAGAAGSTGFSACSRPALLPLRGTRRRGRSASSPLRTRTSSPTSCEGYEPRSGIARVPARLDAFVSAAPKISRTPRDSRATSPGSSARARSRRRDTAFSPPDSSRVARPVPAEKRLTAPSLTPHSSHEKKDPRVPEAQAVGNPRRVRADHRAHLRGREARHRG